MMRIEICLTMVCLAMALVGCNSNEMFSELPVSRTGIDFQNDVAETPEVNIFNYLYFYNGGGVAMGDVNGDNLPDLYFTANQLPNKLYLNRGMMKFEDVTQVSGVVGFDSWCTGVAMADVNGDGRLDLYVSYLGDYLIYKSRNQLFINQGNDSDGVPMFKESAVDYGLDLVGFSTQATFFDFDNDGDLDMYMLNHSVHQNGTFGKAEMRKIQHPTAGDKLLRNDNGRFVDVSIESGIFSSALGYGLGVVVSDVNMDGWLDIYVGNDFHENDYLYINQGNGKFKEMAEIVFGHTSRYTMGVDFADIDNDLHPDLFSADMLPSDYQILKSSMAEDPYDVYQFKAGFGYSFQYARNNLQINNQNGTFSEIGLLANVYATDWSWSSLFADVNLDGLKDILVANGIFRRSNDLDYINFIAADSIQARISDEMGETELNYIRKMPQIKLENVLFLGTGNGLFARHEQSGFSTPTYSNGMAYGDLDNDGDLDLAVNNLNQPCIVYENKTINGEKDQPNFVRIILRGAGLNTQGVGAKVFLFSNGVKQVQEVIAVRGFQSTVDTRLIFGARSSSQIDSLWVVWPGGTMEKRGITKWNQEIVFKQENASSSFDYALFSPPDVNWMKSDSLNGLAFKHRENDFVEFNREYLMPHMISAQGPALAVGDIDGDGNEDVFVGGAKRQPSAIFLQRVSGQFSIVDQPEIEVDSICEDVAARFVDIDGDSDLDLVVVSGGNEYWGKSVYQSPRLYLNSGKGIFSKCKDFPVLKGTFSCVVPIDVDQDGDLDLFFGARAVPWKYGVIPESKVIVNNGSGIFADSPTSLPVSKLGLITDAVAADVNLDGQLEIVISCEWSSLKILELKGGALRPLDSANGLELTGLWQHVSAYDYDHDGDVDILAGNFGGNSKWKPTIEDPVNMYVGDFDGNDSIEQVITHFVDGHEMVFATRDELVKQMPSLKKKFLSYRVFSETGFEEMFSKTAISKAQKLSAVTMYTTLFVNQGNHFVPEVLPGSSQFSPVRASGFIDIDEDGKGELLLGGNYFRLNAQLGRYDASYGTVLKRSGNIWSEIPNRLTGFFVKGEVVAIQPISISGKRHIVCAKNNDYLHIFELNN